MSYFVLPITATAYSSATPRVDIPARVASAIPIESHLILQLVCCRTEFFTKKMRNPLMFRVSVQMQ